MRRRTPAVAALIAALSLTAPAAVAGPFRTRPAPPTPGMALAPGDTVMPIQATTLDGEDATVAWAGAKVNLVNFWATWCVPCREEMPEIQALHAGRKKDGVRVVGVIVQDRADAAEAKKVLAESKIDYLVLRGDAALESAWHGIRIIPTTFLVDDKGKVIRKYVGTGKDELAALNRDVDDYLAGRPLGAPYLPPPELTETPSPAP